MRIVTAAIINFVIIMPLVVAQTQAHGAAVPRSIANVSAAQQVNSADNTISAAPADNSEKNFQKARASFLQRDTQAAAAEIRRGAEFLRREANHATGEAKEALRASVQELEKLAADVEGGAVTSIQDLRGAFARADRALAEQHFQNAVKSWSKKEVRNTSDELRSAADDVEQAFSWAGQKLNSATAATIKDARAVAAKLSEGAGWTSEEVGKGLDAMSHEVAKLRARV